MNITKGPLQLLKLMWITGPVPPRYGRWGVRGQPGNHRAGCRQRYAGKKLAKPSIQIAGPKNIQDNAGKNI